MLEEAARDHAAAADAAADWLGGEFVPRLEPDCEPPRLKVLVVEDDAGDYERIEWCLQHMAHYEPQITLAGNAGAARMAIASGDFDVVLVAGLEAPEGHGDVMDAIARSQACGPALLLTSGSAGAASQPGSIAKAELSPRLLEAGILKAIRGDTRRTGETGTAAASPAERGVTPAAGAEERLRQELIAEIERCALGIERELQGQARFAASRWAAAKVRCLAANLAPLETGASRAVADGRHAVHPLLLVRRGMFDVQSVVVEVALAARCEDREAAAGPGLEVGMALLDRPVLVRGDRSAFLCILAQIVSGAAAESARPGRIVLTVSEGEGGAELQVDWTAGARAPHSAPSSRVVFGPFGGWMTRSSLPCSRRRLLVRLPGLAA